MRDTPIIGIRMQISGNVPMPYFDGIEGFGSSFANMCQNVVSPNHQLYT